MFLKFHFDRFDLILTVFLGAVQLGVDPFHQLLGSHLALFAHILNAVGLLQAHNNTDTYTTCRKAKAKCKN